VTIENDTETHAYPGLLLRHGTAGRAAGARVAA